MKKWIGIFLVMLAAAGAASAQKPAVVTSNKAGWHKLGETSVAYQTEKDEIMVIGKDKFKALRISVKDQPIYVSSMTVYFENGKTEDIAVNSDMKAGAESKVFQLGGVQAIKKIAFVYKTANMAADQKAHVEVYGLK